MKSLQYTFKSKRSIIMLTTVIRALQYTLDVAVAQKMKIPDSDAIILFVNFYKLILSLNFCSFCGQRVSVCIWRSSCVLPPVASTVLLPTGQSFTLSLPAPSS